ncbi:hypothetical protein GL218_03692 [Daldinia childiae]|uniref:uncharacterized protein n=1 Tax=Daldinia childiae TaxID=326645 RepID=UPI0014487F38|nr:uncharacterized protein GL218_03692 [Daldinia childiae]KAF3062412.1 hypothetical protein GL218_03692 [Daldinia childiae]
MAPSTATDLFQCHINTLGCFQITPKFAGDFATHQLKLDNIQLRLSRLGEIGIDTIDNADNDANEVERVLGDIGDRIERAKRETSTPENEIGRDVGSNFPSDLKKIRNQFMKSLDGRKFQASKDTKIERRDFEKEELLDNFIKNMCELMDDLERTIPEAKREVLLKLSDEECKGLSKSNLEELKRILQGCDPWLEKSVDKQLEAKDKGNVIKQSRNQGTTIGVQYGDNKGITNGDNNRQRMAFN